MSVLIFVLAGCSSGSSSPSLLPGGRNQAATDPSGWWNAAYQYRRSVSVTGTAGQVAAISLETINLINSGKLRPDRRDLRLTCNGHGLLNQTAINYVVKQSEE
jgi:hypothetical protein